MTVTADQLVVSGHGPGEFDGAGVVSDFGDLESSGTDEERAADGLAAAISAVGFVKDPFEGALSAGVGWLIEHVGFLREPLDMLAGDPSAIEAHAKTWQNVARQLGSTALQRANSANSLTSWQGEASSAYRTAATEQSGKILQAAQAANELSREVLRAGALVGTARSTIRDAIAEFIGAMAKRALLALALGPETAGATVAAFVTDLVVEGSALAGTLMTEVSSVMKSLAKSGTALAKLGGQLGELADSLGKVGAKATPTLDSAVGAVKEVAGKQIDDMCTPSGLPRALLVEGWKQTAKVHATESEFLPL